MKLTFLLAVINVMAVTATGYSQGSKLSLNMKDATIKEVLSEIEHQTDLSFIYKSDLIIPDKKVDIHVSDVTVQQILSNLFQGMNIHPQILDNSLIVLLPEDLYQQQLKITGTVIDEVTGETLPGVNVVIEGSLVGTTTDKDGKFNLQIPDQNAVIVFSFVGYSTQKVNYTGQNQINVKLVSDITKLEDVVVIGYGVTKKLTLTGSVANVKSSELLESPVANVSNALAGRMTGVIVNNRSGEPGSDSTTILIRGKGTFTGSTSPLIIIDGIANREGYERLNQDDIESISVLKDASAAIYGSRAANGVILITTKRGESGKTTFNYDASLSLTKPTRLTSYANGWQLATWENEVNKYKGIPAVWSDEQLDHLKNHTGDPNLYPNYNIYDLALNDYAPQTRHNLSASGGNDKMRYFFSGGYLYQDSYYKKGVNNFKNYTFRSNIDANVTKQLKLSFDVAARFDRRGQEAGGKNIWSEILASPPYMPYYYTNGYPASVWGSNLIEIIRGHAGTTATANNVINSKLEAKWDLSFITKGLYVSGTGAFDFTNNTVKSFTNTYDFYVYDAGTQTYTNQNTSPTTGRNLSQSYANTYGLTLMYRIGYDRSFGKHNLSAFIAYEEYNQKYETISGYRENYLSDLLPYLYTGGTLNLKNDGSASEFAYRNMFGRISYNYEEKYMTEFTLRRDESVKFPKSGRVGYFPGVSAAWRLSRESFIADNLPFVDELKLKGSWGQMGSDNVSMFKYLETYVMSTVGGFGVPTGGTAAQAFGVNVVSYPTLTSTGVPNTTITWEVTSTSNIGIESSLWKGLLSLQAEYFRSKRSNILCQRLASVPSYTGMTLPPENIGKTLNQGIEISFNHSKAVLNNNLRYNIGGNFTFVRNKILYMDESPFIAEYQKQQGYPIDSYLLYLTDGIFNTQEELNNTKAVYPGSKVGDIKYVDYNHDGKIDGNDMVRIFKSATPEIVFGFNLGTEYKGLALNVLFQGQTNAEQYINPADRNGNINIPLWMYDNRWTADNQEGATMPRAYDTRSETVNKLRSDFWLKDATYLRLKTLELSYTVPTKVLSSLGIQKFRIYVNGFNLFTLDKMKGMYDPEVNNELGISYPQTKIYNLGINVSF